MAEFAASTVSIFLRWPIGQRWMVFGAVTGVGTGGGHVPKRTLNLSKIDVVFTGPHGITEAVDPGAPDSQTAADTRLTPGDVFLAAAVGTKTIRFIAIGSP